MELWRNYGISITFCYNGYVSLDVRLWNAGVTRLSDPRSRVFKVWLRWGVSFLTL